MKKKLVFIMFFSLMGLVHGLVIDESAVGMSQRIPTRGKDLVWLVPLRNDTAEAFAGEIRLVLRVAPAGRPSREVDRQDVSLRLAAGASRDVALTWRPERTGYYDVAFEVENPDLRVTRRVPVVDHDMYFVWFGAPKEFRWCNVPTTVKVEDRAWWLRRGALPCAWKGGICYKDRSVDQFVKSWGDSPWIGIDEVGGPGEATDKFIEAWRRLRKTKPDQFVLVWFMGAHRYWGEIKDEVDLFVPEIYLNYATNHLGRFDAYFRVAREAGVMDHVIPGLGINQVLTKDKTRVTVSPTEADVLRQIRYVKRTAPELHGIGFFTSYSCAPGVAEYADRCCEDYFIRPVLTLSHPRAPLRVAPLPGKAARRLRADVRNIGGMDASAVWVEWRWGEADTGRYRRVCIGDIPCGATRKITCDIPVEAPWTSVELRLLPAPRLTLLDARGRIDLPVFAGDGAPFAWASLPPLAADPLEGFRLLSLPPAPPADLLAHAGYRDAGRNRTIPCTVLPAAPGMERRWAAVVLPGKDRDRCLLSLQRGTGVSPSPPDYRRQGDRLIVRNDRYLAELDLARDVLVRLAPAGCEDNLFRGGWRCAVAGHAGFGEARLRELPGALVVTIPFASPQASGESQYVFFRDAAPIRIARSWIPRGEVTLSSASERCDLFQHGGTFVLRPGVGGVIRRGRLHDGSAYRDLLFGYLGEAPREENAGLAGWLDFSYGTLPGGLGVAIERRWRDADTKSYDVTRLYDASDWLEVLHLWGKKKVFRRPQYSCIYLVPHGQVDFSDPATPSPTRQLWRQIHREDVSPDDGV